MKKTFLSLQTCERDKLQVFLPITFCYQMQDRLAVFACNLKPAKMRGILSEGMIMCASTPQKVQVVDVPAGAVPGDMITFPDYPGIISLSCNILIVNMVVSNHSVFPECNGLVVYRPFFSVLHFILVNLKSR